MNEILLRRKHKVIVHAGSETLPEDAYIAAVMKNAEAFGYIFSRELFETLQTLDREALQAFYLELIPLIKNLAGADKVYHMMYPDFPRSVMEETKARLYLNAYVHYWSNGTLYPRGTKSERLPFFEETKLTVLGLGSEDDLKDIFYHLCQSKTSISQTDKEDLAWIFRHMKVTFPEEIYLKENAALIGSLYLENNPLASSKELQRFCRTAVDVLRLMTAMSDGDISLAANAKFRSFRRRERRMLLELLENCQNLEEDMLRHKNRWIRAGERIHPSEYSAKQFGKAIAAFDKLRNGIKIETFAGNVAKAAGAGDFKTVLALLKKRPGELARKLDYLFRSTDDKQSVLHAWSDAAGEVSVPVLLQVKEHFAHRADEADRPAVRVFFPKGSLAKCYCMENNLPEIGKPYCEEAVKICTDALVRHFSSREFLGRVYLSEEFRHYAVPFSQRSAGKALKTIARGSKLPLQEKAKAIRGFIWWTNMDDSGKESSRADLDLSAVIFDENWNYMEHVSYTNLRSDQYQACHSGDIVNGGPAGGDGVSEFLDADIDSVVNYGARYLVYQVYSYTGQKFSEMPHAMFGWMSRQDVQSGEIFEPKAVEQKMDLASHSTVCIPVIFDCVSREIIWCDMSLSINGSHAGCGGSNVESNLSGVTAVCYSMANMKKPNLYDLIQLHIRARGQRTDSREEADIIFDTVEGITPFDTEIFMAEYL